MNEIINFGEKKRVKIIMLKGEKGDTGDAGDYSGLSNKPKINDVEINGNMTASDLGLVSETEFEQSQTVTDTSIDRIKESFATVEPSSDSSHAYTVGQYLVYNGYLYKTLQAISIGDTLNDTAPSGNIALVTVADELNAIQSDVVDAQTDIGTLQTNVGTLQSDMTTAQGDITNLVSRVNNADVAIAKKQDNLTHGSFTGNIDALTTTSIYWCRSNEVSGTQPSASYYVLFIVGTLAGASAQIAIPYGTSTTGLFVRLWANSSWGSWRKIASTT